MRPDLRLLAAALPALGGSLLLMRHADVGTGPLILQIAVAVVSFAAVALTRPRAADDPTRERARLAVAIATVVVWAPVWTTSLAGPERWLTAGGVRLYVASAVLPAMVLVLARALREGVPLAGWSWGLMTATLWGLATQPDASQATACALACALPLARASAPMPTRLSVATALAAGVAWAWWQPDPLLPVPHVEGVLELAAAAGPMWFAAAVITLALPLLALARLARASNDTALLSVAIYYVAIDVLAWRQRTPMPLLGYGAGPVVGYALMVASARLRP
jgi:cell division protein FtsW (lipid II flippase)